MNSTITQTRVPVLGELREQPEHRRLTDFMEFRSPFGVDGLARVRGNRLEILAVISVEEGKGHFRDFVSACQQRYVGIRFWALMNPELEKALTRYGFYGGNDVDEFGDVVDVMDWTAPLT